MKRKEVEKILQESADAIELKDFSERWEEISDRISLPEDSSLTEPCDEVILVAAESVNVTQSKINKKLVYSLCAAFLIIIITLAVVLPLTLKGNDGLRFLNLHELTSVSVYEDEFYNKLDETDLEVVNFNKLNAYNYGLFYSSDNELTGGKLAVVDDSDGTYAEIVFYGSNVTSEFEIGTDYQVCDINGFNIKYKTENQADIYATRVKAEKNGTNYEFECLGVDENISGFLEKLFG